MDDHRAGGQDGRAAQKTPRHKAVFGAFALGGVEPPDNPHRRVPDDPPLDRDQRRELQRLLTARGFDVGEPDGRVGQKTRDAIKQIEASLGMRQQGRPGGKVLQALRGR